MALITCPECGGKISDKAKVCIHCGYPLEEMCFENANTFKLILAKLPDKGKSKWIDSIEYSEAVKAVRGRLTLVMKPKEDINRIIDNCPALLLDGLTEKNADILIQQLIIAGAVIEKQKSDSPLDEKLNAILNARVLAEVVCPECGCIKIAMLPSEYRMERDHNIEIVKQKNFCQKCGYGWEP